MVFLRNIKKVLVSTGTLCLLSSVNAMELPEGATYQPNVPTCTAQVVLYNVQTDQQLIDALNGIEERYGDTSVIQEILAVLRSQKEAGISFREAIEHNTVHPFGGTILSALNLCQMFIENGVSDPQMNAEIMNVLQSYLANNR